MIIKKRKKPIILNSYESILARLRNDFTEKEIIEQHYSKSHRHFLGMTSVDFSLKAIGASYTILHEVYIKVENQYLEVDNLIITPHTIYIIDVNNDIVEPAFEFTSEQIQNVPYKPKLIIEDLFPFQQLEIKKIQLQKWLESQELYNLSIEAFIVISDPKIMMKIMQDTIPMNDSVIMVNKLQQKITDLEQEKSTHPPIINHEKLGDRLKSVCKKKKINILKKYRIKEGDVLTGVACPECGKLGMLRYNGKWQCQSCKHISKHAHRQALMDYYYIFQRSLTNREAAKWLHVTSRHIVKYLLKSANYVFNKKQQKWFLK
ncbi:NERD domain-containing protein [Oceanobacillus kimchii]|uniref:NERD domain-containing protein n=1 Tax=Oceanobacillus kimchii TaxID=746691 RepID=UPI0021A80146|nr:NERD domain-containing protein [Oceanobacillus kimchii]MCT2134627.1 NERD domain-containing protein [Oceanobacillus kimchii]